ncbi:hypothetical protein [Pelolinea submarina]|uniref:Uncharacterized protein n=1 Tax=Pelolinea submarina TaxID=913107 RepID=A0A347ZS54_9CHLR|nr:hypothetical protein [Pelolinea submarina]REG11300.1 hypothetical protein DFR64_1178 [Pelolinea submarina]BBB48135.1 hypothetical protein Pelsub_P1363 [Pelolinea submarina]
MKKALYPILIFAATLLLISARNLDASLRTIALSATPTASPAPAEEAGSEPNLYAGWDYAAMDAAIPMFHDGSHPLMKESLEADVEDYLHHDPDFSFYYYQFTKQGIDAYGSVAPMDFWGLPFEEVCDSTNEDILDPDLFMAFLDARYPAFVEDYGSWDESAFYDTVLFISKETDEYGDYTAIWPKDGGLTIVEADGSVQYFYADPAEWSEPLDWETLSPDEQELAGQGFTMIWRGLGEDGESVGRADYHDLETFLGIE